VSCSSCVEAHRPLPEALARIRELGFHYVDLIVTEGMEHIHPSKLAASDSMARDVGRAVARSGLEVSSLNCGFGVRFSDEADVRRRIEREWLAILRLAEEVGCSLLTLQLGGFDGSVGRVEAFDRGFAGLGWLLEVKGDREVQLSFEPHSGSPVEKPADALYMVKRLWPEVGVAYDPSHFVMQSDIASLDETEPLLDYSVHVHVRNAARGRMQAPMDEGTTDFAWVVSALRKREYAGALAIEYLDGAEADALRLREVLLELGVSLERR